MPPEPAKTESSNPEAALVRRVLEARAFGPVFQRIADLATGFVVGYEASTEFGVDVGRAALLEAARTAGLDVELEIATLRSALLAARGLPGGRWLTFEVSPRLLGDSRLAGLLATADRRVHIDVPARDVPESARAVGPGLRAMGDHVGLALSLSPADLATCDGDPPPDIFKLEPALTRRASRARRNDPMFALRRGAALEIPVVADGIDAAPQARRLAAVGIEYGQGPLYGGPVHATVRPSTVN
jgi:EAL domain-containing protein (putative c-di-GMP-specific phosphodiesterase class I)